MPRERCEDAPCCGCGGICGQAIGMSYESYESGWDERSDEEIKEQAMRDLDNDWPGDGEW